MQNFVALLLNPTAEYAEFPLDLATLFCICSFAGQFALKTALKGGLQVTGVLRYLVARQNE